MDQIKKLEDRIKYFTYDSSELQIKLEKAKNNFLSAEPNTLAREEYSKDYNFYKDEISKDQRNIDQDTKILATLKRDSYS